MATRYRRARMVVALTAAGLLAAACTTGASTGTAASRNQPKPGASPTTTAPAGSPAGTSTASGTACTGPELAVTPGTSGAAGGHNAITILFTNTSRVTCQLDGYPGVAGLDASGNQVTQAARTASGYLGGW